MSVAMGFCQGTQERVRNSRGKRAICFQAIAVLLCIYASEEDHRQNSLLCAFILKCIIK